MWGVVKDVMQACKLYKNLFTLTRWYMHSSFVYKISDMTHF